MSESSKEEIQVREVLESWAKATRQIAKTLFKRTMHQIS